MKESEKTFEGTGKLNRKQGINLDYGNRVVIWKIIHQPQGAFESYQDSQVSPNCYYSLNFSSEYFYLNVSVVLITVFL